MSSILSTPAGLQQSQAGSETQRARQDAANQARQTQNDRHATDAAGIAETDGQSHESHDRDADGRRAWEFGGKSARSAGAVESETTQTPAQAKDPTGQAGNQLDLSG
jgi:hypothetical protein